MRFALLATLPAMAVMVVLAVPMITLFGRGAFYSTRCATRPAGIGRHAVGIVALVWIKILAPAFYAQRDTATPVKIAVRGADDPSCSICSFVLVVF